MYSLLDSPAISGHYLFPQPRELAAPVRVAVDGAELACFYQIDDPDQWTLIHFHGNGEAVADYVPEMANEFTNLGLNSLFIEYREYGGSSGRAQLVSMLGDGEAVVRSLELEPEKCIAFGRSIGSLYALELVRRLPTIGGLIIESGIAAPAERFLTYADLRAAEIEEEDVLAEVKQHFDHRAKLWSYRRPILIMHCEQDDLVDISHAERLQRWARGPKLYRPFPQGNHNTIMMANYAEYFRSIKALVRLAQADDHPAS